MRLETFGLPDAQGNVVCRCPFGTHVDNHPSASYNVNTGLLYCFSCKQGANDVVLRNKYNIELPEKGSYEISIPKRDIRDWRDNLRQHVPFDTNLEQFSKAKEYAINRGVTNAIAEDLHISLTSKSVVFNFVHPDGRHLGYIERFINPNEHGRRYMTRGEKPPLWPLDKTVDVEDNARAFIVEGAFSVVKARALGYQAFSLLGSSTREAWEIVYRLALVFDEVVASFDNDHAGRDATWSYLLTGIRAIIPGFSPDDANDETVRIMFESGISIIEARDIGLDIRWELFG